MNYNYITLLSNWLLGYDKYSKIYSKANLHKSTYPNEFYLLKADELDIGINKARRLLEKLNIKNGNILSQDKIIRIETELGDDFVKKNERNGLGWVIPQNWIKVMKTYVLHNGKWIEISIEELTAFAYKLDDKNLLSYSELKPRSLSILPVAKACQADCKFCFSESSISFDQKRSDIDFDNLEIICKKAKENGAERFVITGGGEPTLIKYETLLNIIKLAKQYFNKIVLISNGLFLSEDTEDKIVDKINLLIDAGLSVLAISYHHYNFSKNAYIMGKEIKTDSLLDILSKYNIHKRITLRLICVLQKEGINNIEEVQKYIEYAISNNISQVCFKELYVSSTQESLYTEQEANQYSEANQIPLSMLIEYLNEHAHKIAELPWGSPVYNYRDIIDIAAYTEPSVGWERLNGIARSWNIMADGKCFVSLEDKESLMEIEK